MLAKTMESERMIRSCSAMIRRYRTETEKVTTNSYAQNGLHGTFLDEHPEQQPFARLGDAFNAPREFPTLP